MERTAEPIGSGSIGENALAASITTAKTPMVAVKSWNRLRISPSV